VGTPEAVEESARRHAIQLPLPETLNLDVTNQMPAAASYDAVELRYGVCLLTLHSGLKEPCKIVDIKFKCLDSSML